MYLGELGAVLPQRRRRTGSPQRCPEFAQDRRRRCAEQFLRSARKRKEKLKSNYLRLLLNLWIYEVFVLGTTYAAILQSTLSNNVQPTAMSMEQLIINGDHVGYQKGSYVFDLLKHRGFQEQKLKPYTSIEEYATALSRGSHNNGVSAIIDEIPYLKVFLAKYADRYTMAGPTFRPGGFGFLFRKGSSIVPDVSRAIQEFIDGEKMTELEKKWFDPHEPNPTPRDMILCTHDFLGVFLITEPISVLTLLIFIISITCKYWTTKRSSASNRAVEASNTEELFLRFYIEMNGSHTNEHSHIVQGESDQATPNVSPLEVGVNPK
ncbi:glutamate receptor 2.8-like protein [Cinnamomum micranthum f. kanehirae]|uniref:Glutamate receptor 2.8-like protein n=1 Tax=Cinnamomum micranthum f. kanehirae TaxID=337451 RepID=A0A3S3P1U9_9MAGN|nr:glutamate receptor 2.8-like protein [Cinnamomum micranthum f. kanehirae]